MEVTKRSKPSERVTLGDLASTQAGTRVNAEQASKRVMRWADRVFGPGRPLPLGEMSDSTQRSRRGNGAGMCAQGNRTQHGKPRRVVARDHQPDSREGQAGPDGVAERPVVTGEAG